MGICVIMCEVMLMKHSDVKIITANAEEIEINRNELALRLKTDRNYESEIIEKCRKQFNKVVNYRCAYIRIPVDLSQENICKFDFAEVHSKNLYKNLQGCKEVFVFAVTTGIAVDRLLARLNITSQAEHFITDGLSSAAIESFCDYVSDILKSGLQCASRFSAGYGDFSITFQKPLLERLSASETLGITLNSAYLMTPVKSITAIMGIKQLAVSNYFGHHFIKKGDRVWI